MSQYATAADLKSLGLPPDAVEELTDSDIDDQLQASAGVMDLFLASQYALPLASPYPDFLRRCNVCLAVYHILLRRGYNPEEYDGNYKAQHDECMSMLKDISVGKLKVPGLIDDTPAVSESAPSVYTKQLRGW